VEGDRERDEKEVMKQHRFIGSYDLRFSEIVLEDEVARQMSMVLKLRQSEKVVLCDGNGIQATYLIAEISKGRVGLARVGEPDVVPTEPRHVVTLYAAILKRENFEWLVQKATECGIYRIVPILTRRTVKQGLKIERLREIAREAAEQSGRGRLPEILEPMSFISALEAATQAGSTYFFDIGGKRYTGGGEKCSIFIGPEGGWDPEERAMAIESRAMIADLGARVLRAETAATVAVFLSNQ
jgi:16S rRNA (uracil1498-N3)-methyltransferase